MTRTPDGFDPPDVEKLARELVEGITPAEAMSFLNAMMGRQMADTFAQLQEKKELVVAAAPAVVRSFRVRLDLLGTKPPVWRRLVLRGDLTLPRVHDVIQAAMGWTNSHLHRFSTAAGHDAPYFVTEFDIDEGDDGVLEDEIRFDQLVSGKGDTLWYDYDFGDGWRHAVKVEAVLDELPEAAARCLTGKLACPPEDCGGVWGYDQLAQWVRNGCPTDDVPEPFDSAADALGWLPEGWDPDGFDLDEVNTALATAVAEPVATTGELGSIAERLEARGVRVLRHVLGRPGSHGPAEVTTEDALRLTEPYLTLLDVIGDGVTLTQAGYLPPATVREVAERTGVVTWWIGTANREDLTPPVARLRDSAQALGLLAARKGRLSPTAAGRKSRSNPLALWRHIVERLPLGRKEWQRDSGWIALAVVGSDAPVGRWDSEISDLMGLLGWMRGDGLAPPSAFSPTHTVLDLLAGESTRRDRAGATDPAIGATARAVIRRES